MKRARPPGVPVPVRRDAALKKASDALARRRWREARTWFQRAGSTSEALEGLGVAAWWLDDAALVFKARERAYQLYRQRGDRRGAGRVATAIAGDCLYFRGEAAVARGWHRRAHRLLAGLRVGLEHGWLHVAEADLALACGDDPVGARRSAARAEGVGRSLGAVDLEMTALALKGLALITEGKARQGLECLDEAGAAAVSGEMTDAMAIGISCCYVVTACERIRDFARAAQWCARVRAFCQATRFNALLGVCRAQYGSVLTWRGAWMAAETELDGAVRQLGATRPAMQPDALVRLAELRRYQGRFEEAGRLLDGLAWHPLAALVRATIALDTDDPAAAARLAQRYLRQMPAANSTDRARALEILVRAHAGLGHDRDARGLAEELSQLAANIGTEAFRASARAAEGLVARAAGDTVRARAAFEDAVDLYRRSDAAFEEARARMELARTLNAMGERARAEAELRRAVAAFEKLGAPRRAAHAAALLHPAGARREPAASLTGREHEVLGLIAQGLSNKRIGRALGVSEFTAKRHVANILTKLDLPSRAAAAALGARRGLLGAADGPDGP